MDDGDKILWRAFDHRRDQVQRDIAAAVIAELRDDANRSSVRSTSSAYFLPERVVARTGHRLAAVADALRWLKVCGVVRGTVAHRTLAAQ
jgi:hypothetical protein